MVIDPFGVAADPSMPYLADALDPVEAGRQLQRRLLGLDRGDGRVRVRSIRVARYKAGRRCLIEYELNVERTSATRQKATVLGKVHARRLDWWTHALLGWLCTAGFDSRSPDGVSVPEPAGLIPEFHMWLQHKVPGTAATELLAQPGGIALAVRIAEAAHKLHKTQLPTNRRHTIVEELRILHERLPVVARSRPRWAKRLADVLDACDGLAAGISEPRPAGIHRDFYADQVIVDGARLYLVDFDLFCEGDPALDIGNFLAHVTEHSLRTRGDPDALVDRQQALTERFIELSGEARRRSIAAYATLTLVRHISLSTQFPDRQHTTEPLLDLCERRLNVAARQ